MPLVEFELRAGPSLAWRAPSSAGAPWQCRSNARFTGQTMTELIADEHVYAPTSVQPIVRQCGSSFAVLHDSTQKPLLLFAHQVPNRRVEVAFQFDGRQILFGWN